MPSRDPGQKKSVDEQADPTITQKVEALQEQLTEMGVITDGLDDKAVMDEAWGEDSGDH